MKEMFLRSRWSNDFAGSSLNHGIAITHFPALVGRSSECDYRIHQPLISRRHCLFHLRDGEIWVEDLRSLNGTFVNGERITQPRPLHEGDKVDIAFLPYEVCLPLSSEAVIQSEPAPETSTDNTVRAREVLVVDDNADAAQTLAVLLEKWGHRVHVAHNGPDAVRAARAHRPDTVFMDIRLPGEDGVQVAQQLREEAGLERAFLVGITGYDPADALERPQESGFQRLLTKPVPAEALQEVLSQSA